jgi:hypothetical protein
VEVNKNGAPRFEGYLKIKSKMIQVNKNGPPAF